MNTTHMLERPTADVRPGDATSTPDLRAAMRSVASTVCVVTTALRGRRVGMTATSVTSVCLEPPTVLVCINRQTSLHPLLQDMRRLCIQVLQPDQIDVARAFAGSLSGEERFRVGRWSDWDGVPCLTDALASLHCEVEDMLDRGTHSVVLCRVGGVRLAPMALPLVHHNGLFLSPARLAPA